MPADGDDKIINIFAKTEDKGVGGKNRRADAGQ